MADTKISALTELAETPATGDLVALVDVSDTTQAASGTTKKITRTNLVGGLATSASPTFTGTVTLPTGLTGVIRADSGVVSVDSDVTDIVAAGSESAAGKLELATDAETVTGTDTARAVTPANLTAKMAAPGTIGGTTAAAGTFTNLTATGTTTVAVALTGVLRADSGVVSVDSDITDIVAAGTESAAGKLELATDAETVTGTDTARATTPANITAKMAAPGAIGGTTPASIVGTTIDANTDFTIGGTVITNNTITDDGTLIINASTATSFSEGNITNVGDIALDSLTADATSISLNSPLQLVENAPIMHDAVLSADEKYSGFTMTGTLGATIGVGDIVYLAAADSRWELADASAASTSGDVPLAICLTAGNDGDPTTLFLHGKIRSAAFPAFTVATPLYVSETAGDITGTAPTTTDSVMRRVGFALTAEDLYFNPSNDYVTHT